MGRRTLLSVLSVALVAATPYAASATAGNSPVGGFPEFDGEVTSIVRSGSTLYVGGRFTTVRDDGRTFGRSRLAAINAATGDVLPWDPDVRGSSVEDLAVRGDDVYVVGSFSGVENRSRRNVARIDADSGRVKRFAPRINARVDAVAVTKSRVYLGGDFTQVGSKTRRRAAAFARKAPYRVTRWTPKVEGGAIRDVAVRREGVYLAGEFTKISGVRSAKHLALVTPRRGRVVRSFDPGNPPRAKDLDFSRRRVYVAVGGKGGGGALALRRGSGRQLWARRLDGDAEAIDRSGREVYVGGHFDRICAAAPQPGGGACDGQAVIRRKGLSLADSSGKLTGWNPEANSAVGIWALEADAKRSRLYVVGAFTAFHFGANPADRFAAFPLL